MATSNEIIKGMLIGALVMFMIGSGVCVLLLSSYDSSPSSEYLSQIEREDKAFFRHFQQKAEHPSKHSDETYLYSVMIQDEKVREALELSLTDEEVRQRSEAYSTQALQYGSVTARIKRAERLIWDGDAWEGHLKDASEVAQGLDELLKLQAQQCNYLDIPDMSDSSYPYYDRAGGGDIETNGYLLHRQQIYSHTAFAPDNFDLKFISTHPSIAQKIDLLALRHFVHCEEPDESQRLLLQFLIEPDDVGYLHIDQNEPLRLLAYLSALATLTNHQDIESLLSQKVSPQDKDEFNQQYTDLLNAYKQTFGNQQPTNDTMQFIKPIP